jgi:DNA-binding transcriptional ArsR family regulator
MAAKANALKKLDLGDAAPNKERPSTPLQQTVQLDQLIHERVRLGIVSALAAEKVLTFGELKELLLLSDGNLSIHARKLEDAGYIECRKYFEGRRPQTEYKLTASGRKALEKYINHMEAIVSSMRVRP